MDTDSVLRRVAPQGILRIVSTRRLPLDSQLKNASELRSATASSKVVSDFIESSQSWSRERVPLPRRLRWALWGTLPIELFWAIWLATIVSGASPCEGPICTIATLHHHAAALLACGAFSFAGLIGLIPTTRGFARCNCIEIVGLAIASAAGGVALLGIGALLVAAAIVLILLLTFVLALTATSRREMEDARPRTPFPIAVPRGANPPRAERVEPPS
jgi:hypothetical protein